MAKAKKPYCTQNDGECSTCSLVNNNLDCNKQPVWGGRRKGAGRPVTGRKRRQYYLTDEEDTKVKLYIAKLRGSLSEGENKCQENNINGMKS